MLRSKAQARSLAIYRTKEHLVQQLARYRYDQRQLTRSRPPVALNIEIAGTNSATPDFDQVIVNGSVTLAGSLNVTFLSGFVAANGNSFKIIDNDGVDTVSGTFAGLAEGAQFTVGDTLFTITYQGGTGNDVVLSALYTTYVVTNTNDSGSGSLRQAMLDANAHWRCRPNLLQHCGQWSAYNRTTQRSTNG